MVNYFLFTLCFMFLLGGCGQKSVIKSNINAVRTSEAYGDGKHTILPIIVPLSDKSIASFESPLKKLPFVRGFAKMFFDLGATLGLGKSQLSLIQAIPELPTNYLYGLRIKRLFFYIEPHTGCDENNTEEMEKDTDCRSSRLERSYNWVQRVFKGRPNIDFNFLDKIAVKASSRSMQNITNWMPKMEVKSLSQRDFHPLERIFKGDEIENKENSRELILLKYSNKNRDRDTRPLSPTYIISLKKGSDPSEVKNYLNDFREFKGLFKRILILNRTLLVELENDPVAKENVETIISQNREAIDDIGIQNIDLCTVDTCLDLKMADVNLVPLLSRGNGVQIDSLIDAAKVPGNFQLKGFVEFEVQLNLTF